MFPYSLILILPAFMGIPTLAQEKITYQVEYLCETKIVKGRSQDGLNTLHFSGNTSLYIHNEFPTETKIIGGRGYPNIRTLHIINGDSEGLPVYMNFTTDTMVYKNEYGAGTEANFILSAQIPQIKWEIFALEREIGGYAAKLAVGEFGGRIYEAWFTEEIPVPFGPYKLNGLPGLILEAFSRDGMVTYRFKSFKKIPDPEIDIIPPTDGLKVTMEEFIDIRIKSLYRVC